MLYEVSSYGVGTRVSRQFWGGGDSTKPGGSYRSNSRVRVGNMTSGSDTFGSSTADSVRLGVLGAGETDSMRTLSKSV